MVVRRVDGDMVFEEERWKAETESHSCNRDHRDGLGDERASAESAVEHNGALGLWIYVDGGRSGKNRRNKLCVEGPELR